MAVDLALWTAQAEDNNGTREVDKANLGINAQPESTAPHQPSSSMPPKTRSQTERSQRSTLPTLEEDVERLDLEDDIPSRDQQSSPEYDPAAERREAIGIATNTTPKCRKMKTSTIRTEQREGALNADPNEGRCLITNRPKAVELCHLVAKATDRETLTKLEYVWKEGYRRLHVDTKRNLLHLRADWHHLFDTSEWMLVPEAKIVKDLSQIYLKEKCKPRDLAKLFVENTYRYYFLPSPKLKEPICRFPDVNRNNHQALFPPFANLGLLESHIHPQFVIFNTGQKLRALPQEDYGEMIFLLRDMVPRENDALAMLNDILRLYRAWTNVDIPDNYCNLTGTSNRARPPSEGGQDNRSQHGPPPKRERLRSATRSQGQGSQGAADRYAGGQQRAVLPFRPPEEDDSSSVTGDTVVEDEDDTDWIEYIHKWQKESDGVAGKWESGEPHDSRDEQLTAYDEEHARTPPSPGVWDSWKPTVGSRSRNPSISDRSRFSSNDWAVFKNDVYLTRLESRQVDL